jgi:hypothetical protein
MSGNFRLTKNLLMMTAESMRAIAFHLPHFQTIPENGAWWVNKWAEVIFLIRVKGWPAVFGCDPESGDGQNCLFLTIKRLKP